VWGGIGLARRGDTVAARHLGGSSLGRKQELYKGKHSVTQNIIYKNSLMCCRGQWGGKKSQTGSTAGVRERGSFLNRWRAEWDIIKEKEVGPYLGSGKWFRSYKG